MKKIGEIKAELEALGAVVTPETETQFHNFMEMYVNDERGGVQKMVLAAEKRLEKYHAELERTESIKKYEKEYDTYLYICGCELAGLNLAPQA